MSVREADDPGLFAHIEEQNLLRQYDLLSDCIQIGLEIQVVRSVRLRGTICWLGLISSR